MTNQKLIAIHYFSFLVKKFSYYILVTSNFYSKLVFWYILTIFYQKHASLLLFI